MDDLRRIKHDITNCKKLNNSEIAFIKTLDKTSLLELVLHYDNTIHVILELFSDLNDQE